MSSLDSSVERTEKPAKTRSEFMTIVQAIVKDPLGLTGLLIVSLVLFTAIFAQWITPYDPIALNIKDRMQGPSWRHWFGTDQLGRDTLSRVIMGSQVAMQVAIPTILGAMTIGISLGMIAGFGPRWLDNLILLFFDTVRSFPTVMFALAVVALIGPSLKTVIFVIMVTSIPTYGRVVRTQTLSLRNSEFIMAERSMGASVFRILTVHILPNVLGPLAVLAAMDIPTIVGLEAGLSFLGMGGTAADSVLGVYLERWLYADTQHAVDYCRRWDSADFDNSGLHLPRRNPARCR